MKYALSFLFVLIATAVVAHDGSHLHPHGAGSWMAAALLTPIGAVGGYLLGRIHK